MKIHSNYARVIAYSAQRPKAIGTFSTWADTVAIVAAWVARRLLAVDGLLSASGSTSGRADGGVAPWLWGSCGRPAVPL